MGQFGAKYDGPQMRIRFCMVMLWACVLFEVFIVTQEDAESIRAAIGEKAKTPDVPANGVRLWAAGLPNAANRSFLLI